MKKIISLFQRDRRIAHGPNPIRDEVTPGAEWVIAGEGIPTRKFDGTCCMVRGGKLYKRYDAKQGKTPPPGFEPAQDPDPITGHWPGWLAVGDGPDDKWHREALANEPAILDDGTYELCGPKIQGNPEKLDTHRLIRHGGVRLANVPLTFDGLHDFLRFAPFEGIVWHHPDGRMVKIKRKDFPSPPAPEPSKD